MDLSIGFQYFLCSFLLKNKISNFDGVENGSCSFCFILFLPERDHNDIFISCLFFFSGVLLLVNYEYKKLVMKIFLFLLFLLPKKSTCTHIHRDNNKDCNCVPSCGEVVLRRAGSLIKSSDFFIDAGFVVVVLSFALTYAIAS